MSKRRGQNFLISETVRNRIADAVIHNNPQYIWEIGPGIGNLSSVIRQKMDESQHLRLFEYDYGFCRLLKQLYGSDDRISLVQGDFLKTFREEDQQGPDCICGNLPYNVGSVIIMDILKSSLQPARMVFMLQKEVARRIAAKTGDSAYSAFSLHCQLEWQTKILFAVPPGSFYPSPNVTSAVILFERKKSEALAFKSEYFRLVDDIFGSRRKTILNNLKKASIHYSFEELKAAFEASGINCSLRAEKLTCQQLRIAVSYLRQQA
jgi:16S rRNA (adenine1518-N6/adenine1519-N6)-dimethyltransferase